MSNNWLKNFEKSFGSGSWSGTRQKIPTLRRPVVKTPKKKGKEKPVSNETRYDRSEIARRLKAGVRLRSQNKTKKGVKKKSTSY